MNLRSEESRKATSDRMKEYWRLKKLSPDYQPRSDKDTKRIKYQQKLSYKLKEYVNRANAKGLPFDLTNEQFEALCSGTCIYCMQPATGIDRKNNNLGYTESNSQPCCSKCNRMKWTMTHSQFIEQCQRIAAVSNME